MKPGRFVLICLIATALSVGLFYSIESQAQQAYTVKPGDTLWNLSIKFYRTPNLWAKLWELNRHRLSNPHQISVGDVLVIYPLDYMTAAQTPPAPPADVPKEMYEKGEPLGTEYPRFFTFVSDPRGIAGTGVTRIKVEKLDPLTGKRIIYYDEVREVGEVIASAERGYKPEELGEDIHGRLLLSYSDDVVVRFTEDLAKVMDSETHEDPDPYFREFPIYGRTDDIIGPNDKRSDFKKPIGKIHEFKGRLTVVARVESLAPPSEPLRKKQVMSSGQNQESQPVSYVARITNSVLPISIGDRIYMFKRLYPGPDRQTDTTTFQQVDQYKPTQP